MDETKVCQKEKLGVAQSKINLKLSNENGKIAKVLSINVSPCVKNVEVQNACAKIECEILCSGAVFLEDGTTTNVSTSTFCTLSMENSAITPDSAVLAIASIYDNITSQVSSGEVLINAVVSVDVYMDTCVTIDCEKPEDNVYCKEFDYSYTYLKDSGRYNFVVNSTIGSGEVVQTTLDSIVKGIESKNDYFVINGEVYLTTISIVDNGIRVDSQVVPFSEEVAVLGMTESDTVVAVSRVCGEGVINEGDNRTIDIPVYVDYQVYGKGSLSCIADAYSTSNEVNLTTTSVSQSSYNVVYFDENIVSNVGVTDFEPSVDKVVGVVGENINILNTYQNSDDIVVEGVCSVNVIYIGEQNDVEVTNSFITDIPFTFNVPMRDVDNFSYVIPSIAFGDISAKVRKGQLEIVANVRGTLYTVTGTVDGIVTRIDMGEQKPEPDCALEIVVAQENDSLWDVAKRLNVVAEDLIAQNADIPLPLAGGEKLVVYRNK